MIISAASCVLKAKFIDSKRLLETSFEDDDLKMKQLSYNDTLTLVYSDTVSLYTNNCLSKFISMSSIADTNYELKFIDTPTIIKRIPIDLKTPCK